MKSTKKSSSKGRKLKKTLDKKYLVLCNIITLVRRTCFVVVVCLLAFIFYVRTIQLLEAEKLQRNLYSTGYGAGIFLYCLNFIKF